MFDDWDKFRKYKNHNREYRESYELKLDATFVETIYKTFSYVQK